MKKLLVLSFYLFIFSVFPAIANAASLTFSPATGTFNKGCPVKLDIKLDTGGQLTDGTDAIIIYDQAKLTANTITSGSIYTEYPGNSIDDTAGRITISGLASFSSPFSGSGTLATVNFTVKENAQVGATMVKFDYDPTGKSAAPECSTSGTNTCDSNVVQRGNNSDILTSVGSGNYTIGSGTCGASSISGGGSGGGQGAVGDPATPSAQIPLKQPPLKELPQGGTKEFTFMIAILGSALTVLGILGIALL